METRRIESTNDLHAATGEPQYERRVFCEDEGSKSRRERDISKPTVTTCTAAGSSYFGSHALSRIRRDSDRISGVRASCSEQRSRSKAGGSAQERRMSCNEK